MLDFIPFAGAGRATTNPNRNTNFDRQRLQLHLPQSHSNPFVSATVNIDKQLLGILVRNAADHLPPSPYSLHRKNGAKKRWACLPLRQRYYLPKAETNENKPAFKGKTIDFQRKHIQAIEMLRRIAVEFPQSDVMVATDSWFGNNGCFKPLRNKMGKRAHMLSRRPSNNNLFDLSVPPLEKGTGRPRKYCDKLGPTSSSLAMVQRKLAREMTRSICTAECKWL